MADPVRPRWRCAEPGCPAADRWQPVHDAANPGDLDAALANLGAHYSAAHPDLVEEVSGHVQLGAAAA
jgi:hypothetical protein